MKKILLLLCLCLFIEEVASRELDKTFQVASTTTIHRTDFWKRNQLLGVILYSVIRHNFHPHIGRYAQQTSPLPTKGKPIRLQLTSSMFLLLRKDT